MRFFVIKSLKKNNISNRTPAKFRKNIKTNFKKRAAAYD